MKLFIAALALSCLAAGSHAQAAPGPSKAARALPTGVCAVKQIQDAKGGTKPFLAIAPSADIAQLSASGFTPAPCGDALQHLAAYQVNVCKTAAFGNDAVQGRFEQVLGIAPIQLCTFATRLLGESSE